MARGFWLRTWVVGVFSLTLGIAGAYDSEEADLTAHSEWVQQKRARISAYPDHQKLDGQLNEVIRTLRQSGREAALKRAKEFQIKVSRAGRVSVLVETRKGIQATALDLNSIRTIAEVDAVSKSFLRVWVLPESLPELAERLPEIRIVRVPTPKKPLSGLGAQVSESVGLTGAESFQGSGITGAGVRVAVVDLGFIGLSNAIAAGELPSTTIVANLPGSNDDVIESGTDHGTVVAEHVMDMAPGAELHVIMVGDELDLQNAVSYIQSNGIRVANHSVGWFSASYYDDTGPINSIINESHDTDGVFWAVAAGNAKQQHIRRTAWRDDDNDGWLNFTATDENADLITSSSVAVIHLNWNQYGSSVTDLDLFVTDRNGNVVAVSEHVQNGPQDPSEAVAFPYDASLAPYRVWVGLYSGPTNGLDLTMFSFYNDLQHAVAASSLTDPANAHGAFSVAAINQARWNDANPPAETFSSRGPTNDGRMKPDLSAPDRTTSFTYGFQGAPGTSFSSPTVAGAAALLLDQNSSLTAAGLANALMSSARDVGTSGHDTVFGAGQLRLPNVARVLATEDWESKSYSGGSGWSTSSWSRSGDVSLRINQNVPHTGSTHVRLRQSSGYLRRNVNMVGVTDAKLRFWAKVRSFESSDRARVRVCPTSTTCSTIFAFTSAHSDNTYHFYELDISAFPMTSGFRIVFDAGMSSTGDYWYLDDIQVLGRR